MVNVDIDSSIYKNLKRIVEENKVIYPAVRFLVQKLLIDNLEGVKKK